MPFFNTLLGLCMLAARYLLTIPILAIAGSLAAKKYTPASAGTLPTHGPLFVVLLVGVVILVGALTFVPALALGPIVEHLHDGGVIACLPRLDPYSIPRSCGARSSTRSVKLDPRREIRNPVMFTVYVGSILTTGLWILSLQYGRRGAVVVHLRRFDLAVVHGAVRQLCRGHGRRARQGPGRRPAPRPAGSARQEILRGPLRPQRSAPVFTDMLRSGEADR